MAVRRISEQLSFSGLGIDSPQTDRLIFLARPDEVTARCISHVAYQLKHKYRLNGRMLRPELFHLSLLHIHDYCQFPQEIADRAKEAASCIAFPPVDVIFDKVMSFSGVEADPPREDSYALVLLASNGAAELTALRKDLALSMMKAGIKLRHKLHFKPHLTLLYDKRHRIVEDIEPIRWTVNEFALIDSLLGRSRYKQLRQWPLSSRRSVQSASPSLGKDVVVGG